MKCIRCQRPIPQTSNVFCQQCQRDLSAKRDNGTEMEERVEAWQKRNIRRD